MTYKKLLEDKIGRRCSGTLGHLEGEWKWEMNTLQYIIFMYKTMKECTNVNDNQSKENMKTRGGGAALGGFRLRDLTTI